jgi:tetratricopeptide (TPR) repeat protein
MGKTKAVKAQNPVPTGQPGDVIVMAPTGKRLGLRPIMWLLLGAVLIIAGGAVSFYAWQNSTKKVAQPTPEQKYKAVVDKSATLDRQNNFSEQAQTIEAYLKTNPPKTEQAPQLSQLSATYLNTKDYAKAIDANKRLLALDPSPMYQIAAYEGLGRAYALSGDKVAAIDAYKKALVAMKAAGGRSNAQTHIEMDQAMIRQLGGES